jgi:hypothetical protein
MFSYTPALAIACFAAYSWWVPSLSIIIAIISVPILEGLSRSGLPRVPGAIW